MPTKLKEDKKREILEFLEKRIHEEDVLRLDKNRVIQEFTDDTYHEENIEEIIDELDEEDLIEGKTTKLELLYPVGMEYAVEEKIENLSSPHSLFGVFFFGFILFGALLQFDPFLEFVMNKSASPSLRDHYFQAALAGIVGSYLLGKGGLKFHSLVQEQIPVLKEYRYVSYPIVGVGAVCSLAVIGFSSYTSQPIELRHVLGLLTISVVGGTAIGRWVLGDE